MNAIRLARKGDYRFYKDIKDRLHGLPKQSIDHTTGGKQLPVPIMNINTGSVDVLQVNDRNEEDSQSN